MKFHPSVVTRIRRALDKHRYEETEGGLLLPDVRLTVGGFFTVAVNDEKPTIEPNIVVNEGLDSLLDIMFHGGTQLATWYVGAFTGNVTPLATWTAANVTANSTEWTTYDETTRPEWVESAVSAQSLSNLASRAVFTANATATVRGAFLVSNSTKSGAAGKLFAANRFAADRSVGATDVLNVGYSLTAASS